MQVHAVALQVTGRRRVLSMTKQQPHGGKPKTPTGRRQRVQVVGMRTAQADHPLSPRHTRGMHMFGQFEPLITADKRVNPVQTQHRHFHPRRIEPVQVQAVQWRSRLPVDQRPRLGRLERRNHALQRHVLL